MSVTIKKVGRRIFPENKTFTYKDIKFDIHGWAHASEYLPLDFDLVIAKIKDKEKEISAWCKGRNWEGIRMKLGEEVEKWKKIPSNE